MSHQMLEKTPRSQSRGMLELKSHRMMLEMMQRMMLVPLVVLDLLLRLMMLVERVPRKPQKGPQGEGMRAEVQEVLEVSGAGEGAGVLSTARRKLLGGKFDLEEGKIKFQYIRRKWRFCSLIKGLADGRVKPKMLETKTMKEVMIRKDAWDDAR